MLFIFIVAKITIYQYNLRNFVKCLEAQCYMSIPKIVLPNFDFSSPLTDLIIKLDHLRNKQLSGPTPPPIFFDLKKLFHILESIQSARIDRKH